MNLEKKEKICKIMNLFTLISFCFIVSVVIVVCIKDRKYHPYTFVSYLLTYKKGFISRGIVGSIYSLLFNDDNLINGFIFTNFILSSILTSWFLFNIIKLFKKYINQPLYAFYITLSLCSFPVLYFLVPEFFGRIEIFWYLSFIFILWCFKDLTILKTCFIFLSSAICILIHHGFLFLIAPFICILFLEKNKNKEFLLYGFSMVFVFLLCQFIGKVDYTVMYDYVLNRINNSSMKLYLSDEHSQSCIEAMLQYEFEIPIWKHVKVVKRNFFYSIKLCSILILLNIINIVSIKTILKNFYSINKKTICYIGIIISSLIVLFFFTFDWHRWVLLSLLNFQFFIIFKLNTDTLNLNINLEKIYSSDIVLFPIISVIFQVILIIQHLTTFYFK